MLWAVLESVQVQAAGGEMGDVPSTALTGKTATDASRRIHVAAK